jgi:DNA-binding transcriptional MerR regulator
MYLTIGKIARQTGLGIETSRFYEKEGLLAPPPRNRADYRLYPEEEFTRLRFIKRAKELGFSLKEIREMMMLHDDPQAGKGGIKKKTQTKIAAIRSRINDLERLRAALENLESICAGTGPVRDCSILRPGKPRQIEVIPINGG